jgi:hypothetical protein
MQRMEKVMKIYHSKAEVPKDYEYWLTRPMSERLAALEYLRSVAYPDYDPRGPIQRVYRVVTRERR